MLGLVGKHLYDHEDKIAHCTVMPNGERVNLQPWVVEDEVQGAKDSAPKKIVYRPATEEDFKILDKITNPDGKKKNPLIGVLPDSVAAVKKKMFDQATKGSNNAAQA